MKIKFNWGTGIFIVIIAFVGFFISFIIFSQTQEINFVTEDYYTQGINHQEKIDKKKNTDALGEDISVQLNNEQNFAIKFPAFFKGKKVSGNIQLYYVTDGRQDKNVKIELDENLNQIINTQDLPKGRYFFKIDWQAGGKSYYYENKSGIILK